MIQSNAPFKDDSLPSTPVRCQSSVGNLTDGVKLDSEVLKAGVLGCIGTELGQVEKLIRAATSSQYEEVAQLCKSAASMGGKRLRPTLVWLAARALTGEQLRNQLDSRTARDLTSIAAAVELVHAASLVHDDVMDGANERRHQPRLLDKSETQQLSC